MIPILPIAPLNEGNNRKKPKLNLGLNPGDVIWKSGKNVVPYRAMVIISGSDRMVFEIEL
jgi:hypothetical protein